MTHDNRADPRVTIAIPVYKRLRFLPQCLQSIAEQDYPEIELLVSDNGENGQELRELVAEHYPARSPSGATLSVSRPCPVTSTNSSSALPGSTSFSCAMTTR